MKQRSILALFVLVSMLNFASAIIVDADYVTIYPGEDGRVSLNIENNENFDIEDISVSLILEDLPFTAIGSSSEDVDDINENDDDNAVFTLRPSVSATPGDYEIPYIIEYTNAVNSTENLTKTGSFGIRVSARTDLDFAVDLPEPPILGREGQISVEVINRGLGEIRSVSIQVLPQGFDLLSKDKIFVGTIDSDDSDTATFDVIYKNLNPVVSAKISYKDFDNVDRTETVNIPIKVYSEEEALRLGLIQKSKIGTYVLILLVVLVLWFIWRRIRKRRKQKELARR